MESLVTMLITKEALIAAAAIVALLGAIKQGFPNLESNKAWRRALPFVPLLLGIITAVFVPTAESIGERILIGFWIGFIATNGRKIFKQSILGRIKE